MPGAFPAFLGQSRGKPGKGLNNNPQTLHERFSHLSLLFTLVTAINDPEERPKIRNLTEINSDGIQNNKGSKIKIMEAALALLVRNTEILAGMAYGTPLDSQIIAMLQTSQDSEVEPDAEDVLLYDPGQGPLSFAAVANPDDKGDISSLAPDHCSLLGKGDSCWDDVRVKGGYIILQHSQYVPILISCAFYNSVISRKLSLGDHAATITQYLNWYRNASSQDERSHGSTHFAEYLVAACSGKMERRISHWAAIGLLYNMADVELGKLAEVVSSSQLNDNQDTKLARELRALQSHNMLAEFMENDPYSPKSEDAATNSPAGAEEILPSLLAACNSNLAPTLYTAATCVEFHRFFVTILITYGASLASMNASLKKIQEKASAEKKIAKERKLAAKRKAVAEKKAVAWVKAAAGKKAAAEREAAADKEAAAEKEAVAEKESAMEKEAAAEREAAMEKEVEDINAAATVVNVCGRLLLDIVTSQAFYQHIENVAPLLHLPNEQDIDKYRTFAQKHGMSIKDKRFLTVQKSGKGGDTADKVVDKGDSAVEAAGEGGSTVVPVNDAETDQESEQQLEHLRQARGEDLKESIITWLRLFIKHFSARRILEHYCLGLEKAARSKLKVPAIEITLLAVGPLTSFTPPPWKTLQTVVESVLVDEPPASLPEIMQQIDDRVTHALTQCKKPSGPASIFYIIEDIKAGNFKKPPALHCEAALAAFAIGSDAPENTELSKIQKVCPSSRLPPPKLFSNSNEFAGTGHHRYCSVQILLSLLLGTHAGLEANDLW